jgi:phage protein D
VGAQTNFTIKIGSVDVEKSDVLGFTIERDMFQPDMCAIVLSNQENNYSPKIEVAGAVEVNIGDGGGKNIYKGEVTGMEATFRGGEKSRLLVRGMNKMHRLLRKRKSVTFMDKTDEQIIKQVANDAGLSVKWQHDVSISYKHVYQHNLTDLEFIRMRAARIGAHVWCVGTDLYVQKPDLQSQPIAFLKVGESGDNAMKSFTPRLSSTAIVNKVTVKGWNPEKKELITGNATVQTSKLGKENSVKGSADFGNEETFTVDHPIWSPDEATALAKARLQDLSLSFITGEAEVGGSPVYELGKVVQIISNPEKDGDKDPFNGNYYLMGVTQKYSVPRNKDGGYTTILRLARDAQKGPKE